MSTEMNEAMTRLSAPAAALTGALNEFSDTALLARAAIEGFSTTTRHALAAEMEERAAAGDPFARRSLAAAGHPRWVPWVRAGRDEYQEAWRPE